MEKIYAAIRDLTEYALATELIAEEDVIYTVNSLLGALGIDDYPGDRAEIIGGAAALDREKVADGTLLEGILAVILDHASEKGMIDGASVVMRDLFDTKIMGILTPRPSEVIAKFRGIYNEDPVRATDWYYDFSRNTDYIRRYRIAKDRRWKTQTEYGELDITINLSKPEKDPKAIAAARNAAQSSYPKCQLCIENEGYYTTGSFRSLSRAVPGASSIPLMSTTMSTASCSTPATFPWRSTTTLSASSLTLSRLSRTISWDRTLTCRSWEDRS